VLAFLWLWMAVVYHAGFFADINPMAWVFALIFVLQSVLFIGHLEEIVENSVS